jgi:histidyl-tRNA synthetase
MISKPPGVEDIFPDRSWLWNRTISNAKEIFRLFNYREIIIPVMEFTEVFSRGIGDDSDIVSKEMFTFEDRGGRILTLRPEGTASVVRAYVENGEYNRLSSCKLFYCGPMFRAEKPQRGRLRQFNQIGAEFFGSSEPYYDSEIIACMDSIARASGLGPYTLLINSIGCGECRPEYLKALKVYYISKKSSLCGDCGSRLERNPLRLLDCKVNTCVELKKSAPKVSEYLCAGCSEHFASVKAHLKKSGIKFSEDPGLVRGLDYYTRTTFEFITDRLGGQNAFAAGGRYDNLVELFGGKPTPAVGFAAGIERMLLLAGENTSRAPGLDVYIAHQGGETLARSLEIASFLRAENISVDLDPETKGFKNQFKKADREGAVCTIVVGENELAAGNLTIKRLSDGAQEKVKPDALLDFIKKAKA